MNPGTPGLDQRDRAADNGEPFIAVRHLAKVFSKNPTLALAPENQNIS